MIPNDKNFLVFIENLIFLLYLCIQENNMTMDEIKNESEINPIDEARRYVANAEETIKRATYDPETKSYLDKKYVRTAGDILWKGCLIALDAVLHVRKGKGRPSVDKYRLAASQRDRKLLQFMKVAYDTMHLSMGYDGTQNKKTCDSGFEYANALIDRCAMLYHPEEVCV